MFFFFISSLSHPKFVKKMMATWASLHPSRWTTNEVSDWMAFVARQHGIDDETSDRHITVFEDVRGDKLCSMSREDFQSLEPCFGGLYFDVFNKIFHECKNAVSLSS